MIRLPEKRFRKACLLSWAVTLLALGLAMVPNIVDEFNPTLVILTLTLIAIVWYTYFTYRAVNREESTIIQIGLFEVQGDATSVVIRPRVRNLTKRTVQIRPKLEIWVDKKPVPQSEFLSGNDLGTRGPYDEWIGNVPIDSTIMSPKQDSSGEMIAARKTILIRFSLDWSDDLGEAGSNGPEHWKWGVARKRLVAIIEPETIKELFKDL